MERQRGKVSRAPHKKQITNRRRPGAVFGVDNPYMKERDTEALDRKKVIRARIRKSLEGLLGGPPPVGEHDSQSTMERQRGKVSLALDHKKVIRARIRKAHEGLLGGPLAAVGEHPAGRVSNPSRDSGLQSLKNLRWLKEKSKHMVDRLENALQLVRKQRRQYMALASGKTRVIKSRGERLRYNFVCVTPVGSSGVTCGRTFGNFYDFEEHSHTVGDARSEASDSLDDVSRVDVAVGDEP